MYLECKEIITSFLPYNTCSDTNANMFLRLPIPSAILSLLCFIFFFMNNVEWINTTTFHFTNETDRQALLAIKDMIPGDPLHLLRSWNHSIHFCSWQRVTCGRRHQRVTILDLSSLGLVGSLSPHIGNLTFLRTIHLQNNSFHGTIPQEIGRLFRLQDLYLFNNSFQGEFPNNLTLFSDIKNIYVYHNNLGGKIPMELGSLSTLWRLNLARNHFTGTIPPSLGNLSTLRTLWLSDNNLDQGSIPSELGQLSKLEILNLGFTNVSGMVPTLLYNISSINLFSLLGNRLHGKLPVDLGLTLPNLKQFFIEMNHFDGPIPSSLANASGLARINMHTNAFIGPMPMNLGTLHDLEVLNFADNSLGSDEGNDFVNFLPSLYNCSNLRVLDLRINRFKGVLPHSIGNLSTNLNILCLDGNNLSGSIPLGIGNLGNLQVLVLGESRLIGNIPNSIGKLSKLEELYINKTNISGEIPSSIGNLTRLSILVLIENMLQGNIPVSLGNCTSLQEIALENNHLTGPIPEQIFGLSSLSIALFLSNNYLTGILPLQVGSLKNLGSLDVSENQLSGEIPATLGSCEVLEFLNMESNFFQGTIPESFKQLKGIQFLDLSSNNLSGQIPTFLGEFGLVKNLNLSNNRFDGEVPNEGVFRNISAFSVIGNNKLCGGIKELQLPACPTKAFGKRKKPFSQRVIIPLVITSIIVLLLLFFLAIVYRIKRTRHQTSSALALPLQNQFPKLSYVELLQATNGFSSSNLIGEGRYGFVYKGILNSGEQIVAVKVLNLQQHGANKSFMAESEALKTIRHRNLVKIITSCSSIDFKGDDFKALVLEFMENGSLESWLHPSLSEQLSPKSLKIVQRLNIAIDVASALDYLHNHCETTIIHCDLKPSNVLLDDDLCAHVSDFGLARILSATTGISNHLESSSIRGTIGYVAPEYGAGAKVSTQGDMYSYGVLLLEMFTGKRPTENMFSNSISLHSYAKKSLPNKVMELVDAQIILEEEMVSSNTEQNSATNTSKVEVCLASVFQIGISCSSELPSERMNARDVLTKLHKIRNEFVGVTRQEP